MVVYDGDNDIHFKDSLNSLLVNSNFYSELILVINGEISEFKNRLIRQLKNDLKIKPIFLQKNIGLAKALNIACNNVKYQWIARFDSDDLNSPDRFFKIQNYISKYGNDFDVMGTYIIEFVSELTDKKKLIRKVPLKMNEIKKRLIFRNPMNHVSVFFKRKIIEENNYYPLIDGFEDYAFWTKLIYKGYRFKNFKDITVFVRTGSGMIKRRGCLDYIFKEIKLRIFFMKYFEIYILPLNLLSFIIRVILFSLNSKIKKYIYLFIRKF